MNIIFLTAEDVLSLYYRSISRFGGLSGLRDMDLLESAVSQAQMMYKYEKADAISLGSVYCYYLIKDHAFLDGNKRIGLLSGLTFFAKNGIPIEYDPDKLYKMIISIADSTATLNDVISFFRNKASKHI